MITSIDQALFARWNATGLNTAIATLYPGSDTYPGSPELGQAVDMPRAQYNTGGDQVLSVSKGTQEIIQPLEFTVWGLDYETVSGWLDLIDTAFTNCEQAAAHPMQIQASYGTILGVDFAGGKTVQKQDDAVFSGTITYNIRWGKPNRIP